MVGALQLQGGRGGVLCRQHRSYIMSRSLNKNITNMEDIGRFGSVLFECLELKIAVGNGDSIK